MLKKLGGKWKNSHCYMGNKILQGDSLEVLKTLPSESIDCVITSPPYFGLRDYSVKGQIGLEKNPDCEKRGMMKLRKNLIKEEMDYIVKTLFLLP